MRGSWVALFIFFLKKLISSKQFLMKNFFVQGKNFKHFETIFSEEIILFGNPKPEIPGRNFVRKSFCSCRDLGQNDFWPTDNCPPKRRPPNNSPTDYFSLHENNHLSSGLGLQFCRIRSSCSTDQTLSFETTRLAKLLGFDIINYMATGLSCEMSDKRSYSAIKL